MKKTKVILIRVSEEEHQILKNKSNNTGKNLSEYIRLVAMGYAPENIIRNDTVIELSFLWEALKQKNTDKQLLEQLKKIILNLSNV